MLKRLLFAFVIALLSSVSMVQAQSLQDIHKVDVDKLTDIQVEKIRKEINNRGLTIEQASELAKARGASETQIMKLKTKLYQPAAEAPADQESTEVAVDDDATDVVVQKRVVTAAEKSNIFGHSLFNSKNLTFNPSSSIPVPMNYVVNIGDELSVVVWGNSQQNFSLPVSKSGTVNLPNVGVFSVAGQEFRVVRANILSKLTAIYSDMKGSEPQTFAEVTMGSTRSIQVNIVGESNMPGTYTLPGTASVFNALFLSGGPNENGSFRSIQVIRNNKVIQTVDVYDYLLNKNAEANINLRDQDIVYIPVYTTKVTTSTGFKRNAIFEVAAGETLADVFDYAGGFSDAAAITEKVNVKRLSESGFEQMTINVKDIASCELRNGDNIYVNKRYLEYSNAVKIEGAVYEPGDYELKDGMKLSELIAQAGGVISNYYANRGLITRLDDKRFPEILPFDVQQVIDGSFDVQLRSEDQVLIKSIFDVGEAKYVRIEGEVLEPGTFPFQKKMKLKDLILLASGMTESASEASIEVARRLNYEEAAEVTKQSVNLFTIEVNRDLTLSGEDAEFELMPYDYIYIRRAPSYEIQRTVTISGEVKYPGKYVISNRDERISDLIERAGGLTDFAYPDAAYMNRGLDERQKEMVRKINSHKEGADEDIEVKLEMNQLLELQLANIMKSPGSEVDYILKEGDEIVIPVKKEEIWVNGSVLNPSGLAYQGKKVKHYIDAAGGFEKNAKKHKTFVVYPNGSSASTKGFFHRNYPTVMPGSQIVVPAKPEREKTPASTWVALASTISSIAISVVAVFR